MTKIIHQIFLKVSDKSMEDYGYDVNSNLWREWCKENDYQYMLHKEESFEKIRTEKDKEMFERVKKENRHPFCAVDWGKYIVLNHYGGCYIDLDVKPTSKSIEYLEKPYPLIGSWFRPAMKKNEINNQLIAFEKGTLRDCLDYCYEQYEEKSKMEIYDKWKCRFFFQVAGPKVFARWCKKKKYNFNDNFTESFIDIGTTSWLDI